MQILIKTLDAMSGSTRKPSFTDCMRQYDSARNKFNRDFYTITLDQHPELDKSIKKILDKFGVPLVQQSRYRNQALTVYKFLVELNDVVKQDELNKCIEQIKEQTKSYLFNSAKMYATLTASTVVNKARKKVTPDAGEQAVHSQVNPALVETSMFGKTGRNKEGGDSDHLPGTRKGK